LRELQVLAPLNRSPLARTTSRVPPPETVNRLPVLRLLAAAPLRTLLSVRVPPFTVAARGLAAVSVRVDRISFTPAELRSTGLTLAGVGRKFKVPAASRVKPPAENDTTLTVNAVPPVAKLIGPAP